LAAQQPDSLVALTGVGQANLVGPPRRRATDPPPASASAARRLLKKSSAARPSGESPAGTTIPLLAGDSAY
jgi:hypothetical protein